ncbi:MAG: hypothetical protein ACK415_02140 [Thermodesulfovibrionales bacterium]
MPIEIKKPYTIPTGGGANLPEVGMAIPSFSVIASPEGGVAIPLRKREIASGLSPLAMTKKGCPSQ